MSNTGTAMTQNENGQSRLSAWLQDPLGGVIAASVTTIGSFGVVVSGIWLVNLTLS